MELTTSQAMAPATANPTELARWLHATSRGACRARGLNPGRRGSATTFGWNGTCEDGFAGSYEIPEVYSESWSFAARYCLARCLGCTRCRYVSFSLTERKLRSLVGSSCLWTHACNMSGLSHQEEFNQRPGNPMIGEWRSGRVDRRHRALLKAELASWTAAQQRSLPPPPSALRWVVPPSAAPPGNLTLVRGACGRSVCNWRTSFGGDCETGDGGVWQLTRPRDRSSWEAAAAVCRERCLRCSRCAWVSLLIGGQATHRENRSHQSLLGATVWCLPPAGPSQSQEGRARHSEGPALPLVRQLSAVRRQGVAKNICTELSHLLSSPL